MFWHNSHDYSGIGMQGWASNGHRGHLLTCYRPADRFRAGGAGDSPAHRDSLTASQRSPAKARHHTVEALAEAFPGRSFRAFPGHDRVKRPVFRATVIPPARARMPSVSRVPISRQSLRIAPVVLQAPSS